MDFKHTRQKKNGSFSDVDMEENDEDQLARKKNEHRSVKYDRRTKTNYKINGNKKN